MKKQNHLHLENIADLLWLSQFTGRQSVVVENIEDKKQDNQKPKIEDDEVEDDENSPEPEMEELQDDLEVHTDNHDEENSSHTKHKKAKAIQSPKKLALSNYREWEKAFKFINLKQPSRNKYELDEEKTVENIASTRVFDLVFKQVKEKSFFLTIVIDRGETMELWDELIKNFEQMLLTMGVFARVSIYYWDTKDKKPRLYVERELKREISEKLVVMDGKRNLVWVMSDCIAPSWRSAEAFKSIDRWSLKSFTSILQMFPKEMWMGTMLFKGKHIRLSSASFNSSNKKLRVKSSKREKNALKIPVITFDPYALQAWAKVVVNAKNNSISGIELEDLDFPSIKSVPKKEITAEMRMQRFYSQASPTAQKLAFYMSVLPVDFKVTRILQEERLSKSNQAHVAEVFLGGLIERRKTSKSVHYDFYPKIREELNANISADDSFEIMDDMSSFVSSHLGIGFDFKALLLDPNGAFEGDVEISSESLAYAKLASRVLKRKGGSLYDVARSIDERINIIENTQKTKTLDVFEKSIILLYKEDNVDIDLNLIVNILNKICTTFSFRVGKEPFVLVDELVSISTSYDKLDSSLLIESKKSLRSILFTEKAYDNYSFFESNNDILRIISFYDWEMLTTLSKNNGAIYFIGWTIILMSEYYSPHYENTGCIYDFLEDKTGIDKNMREPYICQNCLNGISKIKPFSNNDIFNDLKNILKIVGDASKKDLDIFAKGHEIEASVVVQLEKKGWGKSNIIQEYKLPNGHKADLLLHHQDKDLAIIEIKATTNEPKAGLEQAINYGKQLNIDYVYATNGLEIYEYSIDKQKGNFIDKYPSLDELWERYNTPQKKLRDYPYLNKNLKRHHKEAIITIIEEIINNNKRILLSLVASAGKEVILLEVLNKLDKSNWYENRKPRVLIVVNKNNTRYVERQFESLDENFIEFITFRDMRPNYNDYDIVIIEETPRARDKVSKRDKWQELLSNSKNPIFISFTSLYQDEMKVNFGGLSYEYSLEDSIKDGNTRPYKIIPINESLEVPLSIKLGKKGIRALITIILKNITFKDGIGKTIIICNNIEDVNQVGIALEDTNITQYITLTSEKRQDTWREVYDFQRGSKFRESNIRILIMTKHISDIEFPYIDNIVLMTPITSKYKLVNLLSTRVEKKNLFTEKNIKVIDCFFDEHKNYYNLDLLENDSYPSKNLESFRVEQSKKSQFERTQREKNKKELEAQKEWRAIYDSSSLDVLELFVEKYPDSIYIEAVKKRILNIEYINRKRKEFLESLPPVERKLEELYKDERNIPKSTFLFKKIQDGLFDFDKFEALKLLKKMMMNDNKWKEKSTKNRKAHERTLAVMKMLVECSTKDKINIVEDISQNIQDTFRDVDEQILREEKKKESLDWLREGRKR